MGNLRIWTGIEDGSQFELSVNPVPPPQDNPASIVAGARMVKGDGSEEMWPDQDLQPGPKIFRPIEHGKVYAVRVRVQFLTAGTAEIRAVVRKPNGDLYGEPYVYTFTKNAGDIVRATIGLAGLKS